MLTDHVAALVYELDHSAARPRLTVCRCRFSICRSCWNTRSVLLHLDVAAFNLDGVAAGDQADTDVF